MRTSCDGDFSTPNSVNRGVRQMQGGSKENSTRKWTPEDKTRIVMEPVGLEPFYKVGPVTFE